METNFTLSNKKIAAFFSGDDDSIPVGELLYLHGHPLIKPNFIDEIAELVTKTNDHLITKKIGGHPVEEFTRIALSIGNQLPELTEEGARSILKEFRLLYNLCNSLLTL